MKIESLASSPSPSAYTWDGGGSDNYWGTGANWNPDAPVGGPTAADD